MFHGHMKRILASIALAIGLMFTLAPAAHAACYFLAPTTGNHVTYYNCRGPYIWNGLNYDYRVWQCYADYDWYAEWFWGKHDMNEYVVAGRTCYA